METVQYSKEKEEEDKKVIPGLPVPAKVSKEMFSLSFNHHDHTMIVNFYEDATIHSVENIQRIDRSLQSLAIKPADKLMELASNVTDGPHNLIIVSKDEILMKILSQIVNILLRNLPDHLEIDIERGRGSVTIKTSQININLLMDIEELKRLKTTNMSQSIFLVDSRSQLDIRALEQIKPQNVIVLVSKLEDLANSSNSTLKDLIQRITPSSFLPASDLQQSVNCITSSLLFIEQLIMVGSS